jgi:signal transduction histidine kinase
MFKGSVFRRLVPPLVGIIVLQTVIVTLVGTRMMREELNDRARRRARSLSMIERDSLLHLMQAGDHANLQVVLEQLGREPDTEVVRILRPDGSIHASSRAHETGRSAAEHLGQVSDRGDLLVESGGSSGRANRVVHTGQPFRNTERCQACHTDSGPIVGWLDLDVGVNERATSLGRFTSVSTALGAFYLVAVLAIVVPTVLVVVLRPMRRLTDAMKEVQRGDLAVRMAPTGTREIDTVLEGFNHMVGDLRQARATEEEARRLHLERVEQLAVVGELAAGLAHEVRNPLSGVQAVLDVLTRETGDAARKRVLLDASGELTRVDQILKDLLQFARPKPPTLVPLDLNVLVRDAVNLTVSRGEHPPGVRCDLSASLPAALGDAGQIRQVLVNLLLNAQHAATREGQIIVTTGRDDRVVWCRVQDDGPGVSLDRASAIFRPFVTSKTRGTGLGLSISRRIVELHGGRLVLDNPGLPGASFSFTLPFAAAEGG